jgi:prolyl oligopeptidase
MTVFMNNMNGVLVIANIRGGGEFGDNWRKAAIKDKKQTSFDDFIACAEFLT